MPLANRLSANLDSQTTKKPTAAEPPAASPEPATQGGEPQKEAESNAGAAAILRMAEQNLSAAWKRVHDAVLDGAGEAVGWAEMLGFRYPVKTYEAQVDGNLYRGSRVDFAGMASLKAQGIRGIVNLCAENNDDQAIALKLGMIPHHVPIIDNTAPTIAQMRDFIAFARSTTPCYVHCEAGIGRTGTAVASYRMAVDGWSTDQAIAEAQRYGLSLPSQIAFLRQFGAEVHGAADAPAAAAQEPDSDDPRKKPSK